MMFDFLLQLPVVQGVPADSVVREKITERIQTLASMDAHDLWNTLLHDALDAGKKIMLAVIVFLVCRWVIKWLLRFLDKIYESRNVDVSLRSFFRSTVSITLYILVVFTVVGIMGINTSSFLAIFASAGLAVGMALSGTLQNFAGGVMILLLRPYRVGDFIEAQGQSGTVKDIRLFNTIITTGDNKTIIVPNNGISTGIINNYSAASLRRVDWSVTISYGDDFEKAKAAILEILTADSRIKSNPAPFVSISSLGDSAVVLTVRGWVENADYWDVFFVMNERMYRILPEKGVNFPFPQLDVHVKNS